MNIYIEIKNLIINLVKEKYKSLDPKVFISINCEQPKNLSFGDVSSNVLMVVSKKLGLKSEELKKDMQDNWTLKDFHSMYGFTHKDWESGQEIKPKKEEI